MAADGFARGRGTAGLVAAAALALGLGAAAPAAADPCCGPISEEGQRLSDFLDGMNISALWPSGQHVDWRTGLPDRPGPGGPGSRSHCSAFVAAASERLGVYILRPPEHGQIFLASAQSRWLGTPEGAADGWSPVADGQTAQTLANEGELVVAGYPTKDPKVPGHIVIVRPSEKDAAALAADGPDVISVGITNYPTTTVRAAFAGHPGAFKYNRILYFSHPVDWDAVGAGAAGQPAD